MKKIMTKYNKIQQIYNKKNHIFANVVDRIIIEHHYIITKKYVMDERHNEPLGAMVRPS